MVINCAADFAPIFGVRAYQPGESLFENATGAQLARGGTAKVFGPLEARPDHLDASIPQFPWLMDRYNWNALRLADNSPVTQRWLRGGLHKIGSQISPQPVFFHEMLLRGVVCGHIDQDQAYFQGEVDYYRDHLHAVGDPLPYRSASVRALESLGEGAEMYHFRTAQYAHLWVALNRLRSQAILVSHLGEARAVELQEVPRVLEILNASPDQFASGATLSNTTTFQLQH